MSGVAQARKIFRSMSGQWTKNENAPTHHGRSLIVALALPCFFITLRMACLTGNGEPQLLCVDRTPSNTEFYDDSSLASQTPIRLPKQEARCLRFSGM